MDTARHTAAVVLAGGTGSRMGGGVPKQLLPLGGRTVLERAVAAVHDAVDEVLVVMAADHVDEAEQLLRGPAFPRLTGVVAGGADRGGSTVRALAALVHEECDVLLHDAARPLLPARVVRDCVRALRTAPAVVVAVPSNDTLLEVEQGRVVTVPDRGRLWRAQTPQAFRLSVLRRAYAIAAQRGVTATDDCGVVRACLPDLPVVVVQGDERNLKITHPVDLEVAERLLRGDESRPTWP